MRGIKIGSKKGGGKIKISSVFEKVEAKDDEKQKKNWTFYI